MVKNSLIAFITAVFVIVIAAPAFPAEEPFDTTTASKHVGQGISLLHAKKYDAAIKEFEEAASINPDAEAYYYLGYTYYLKGRNGDEESRQKSRENFSKAYEIDPNFSPTRYKPAEPVRSKDVMLQQGESTEAQRPPVQQTPVQTRPTASPAR
jgi:tetratricopeptide (TPR) repeat protein